MPYELKGKSIGQLFQRILMSPSIDLPFISNEPGQSLFGQFKPLLKDAKSCNGSVAYFQFSGFHKINPSIKNDEKSSIVIRINTVKQFLNFRSNLTCLNYLIEPTNDFQSF